MRNIDKIWHIFRYKGLCILHDVESGSIHLLDDAAAEYFKAYGEGRLESVRDLLAEKYGSDVLDECREELEELLESGELTHPDSEPAYEQYAATGSGERKNYIKSICMHIAHDCNLRCKYCFASGGDFGSGRCRMDKDIAFKAIDLLIDLSGPRRNCEVDFFGGEPLLGFDVVKEAVAYGRLREESSGKSIKFTITTNATLLTDEIIDFIDRNDMNVVLSVDGRPEVNDRMRVTARGTGTQEAIIRGIDRYIQRRGHKDYYVRGTYTSENLDFTEDVRYLAEKGYREISLEPVIATPDLPYSLENVDWRTIEAEYERLADYILEMRQKGKSINFFHFNIDLMKGPCLDKRISGCGAGSEYVAVTPEGDLYPCHQFVGREDFKLGDVYNGITNKRLAEDFSRCNIFTKSGCGDCWARYFCSGGCHANAHLFNGDIRVPHAFGCKITKKRIECAIYLAAMEKIEEAG